MFKNTYRFVVADRDGNEKELGFFQGSNDREAMDQAITHSRARGEDPYTIMGVWDKDVRFFQDTLTIADLDNDLSGYSN